MGCVCSKHGEGVQESTSVRSSEGGQEMSNRTKTSSSITTIYGGGPFYPGDDTEVRFSHLKQSGFTTVMCWTLHIDSHANMAFNGEALIKNDEYVGDSKWPSLLASLKAAPTHVNRLMFSVGSAGVPDFENIKSLTFPTPGSYPNNPDTGSDSKLYKAFDALRKAIPSIDGFDLDDESLYDQPTTVAFSRMLASMGYQVTFCPFELAQFWAKCLSELNTDNSGPVKGFNLQCYAGGAGNNPEEWVSIIQTEMGASFNAKEFVFPGLWCRHIMYDQKEGKCPGCIQSTFSEWKSIGISGGFIWLYDDILRYENKGLCGEGVPINAAAYSGSIISGLS